jgi:hypothetical protein
MRPPLWIAGCIAIVAAAAPAVADVWEDARESVVTVSIWLGDEAKNPTAEANDRLTGCFISPDGYVLTSKRLVEDALRIDVRLADGRELPAERVAADPDQDLALIKIGFVDVPCLHIAGGEGVPRRVIPCAPGEPLVPAETEAELAQTDQGERIVVRARLPAGSRGAPVLDESGKMVGVVTEGRNAGRGTTLVIPIHMAMGLLRGAGVSVRLSLGDPDALRPRPAAAGPMSGGRRPLVFLYVMTATLVLIVIWLASAIVVLGRRTRRRTVQPIFGRARAPRQPPPRREPADEDDDIDIELT